MLHSGPQRITTRQPTRAFAKSEALVIEETDDVCPTAASLYPIIMIMPHLLPLFLLASFFHCPAGLATTVYKSTDENGAVSFSDTRPEDSPAVETFEITIHETASTDSTELLEEMRGVFQPQVAAKAPAVSSPPFPLLFPLLIGSPYDHVCLSSSYPWPYPRRIGSCPPDLHVSVGNSGRRGGVEAF